MCEIRGVEHFSFPSLADGLAYVFAFEVQYAQLAVYFCDGFDTAVLGTVSFSVIC